MPERISSSIVTATMLNDIGESFTHLQRSGEELASGRTISKPSDDPFGSARAIGLQSSLDGLTSYMANVKEAIGWQQAATGTINSIGKVLQRLRAIVVEAGGGVESQGNLESLAEEVSQMTEQVKQDANVQYAGQYVLAGTATSTAPYSAGSEDAYHGNENVVMRSMAPTTAVELGASAKSLLGEGLSAGDGKMLDTMRSIERNLREGTPSALQALHTVDLNAIGENEQNLNQIQARIGTVSNRLEAAESTIEEMRVTATSLLSNTQDANYAQVATEYNSQQVAYEAALRSSSNLIQMSLLNFIK